MLRDQHGRRSLHAEEHLELHPGVGLDVERTIQLITQGLDDLQAEFSRALVGSFGKAPAIVLHREAVKVAVHRLRGRYRDVVRAVVVDTLDDPSELDAEVAALLDAFRTPAAEIPPGAVTGDEFSGG